MAEERKTIGLGEPIHIRAGETKQVELVFEGELRRMTKKEVRQFNRELRHEKFMR